MREYTYLAHHGIKGMHWGVRNFQNQDGSLTPEGKIRYGIKGGLKKMGESARASGSVLKRNLSRAGENAKTIGSVARGEAGKAGKAVKSLKTALKEGSFQLRSKLGTQNAEIERLNRYVNGLKYERSVKARLKSIELQKDWARRKEAGRRYVDRLEVALYNISEASKSRHYGRTSYLKRSMEKMEGYSSAEDRDLWLRSYAQRMVPSSKYSSNVEAAKNWRIARGH